MIAFKQLHPSAQLPIRANPTDAGMDIYAIAPAELWPGVHAMLPTGWAVAIPDGCVGIIKPRSGLATKYSVDVMAGVIDAGYRGEVQVTLINHSDRKLEIKAGDRIAQLLVVPVSLESAGWVDGLDETSRGSGGFGSTGR